MPLRRRPREVNPRQLIAIHNQIEKNTCMTTVNTTPSVDAYFRFLQMVAAVEALPGMDRFGVNERA